MLVTLQRSGLKGGHTVQSLRKEKGMRGIRRRTAMLFAVLFAVLLAAALPLMGVYAEEDMDIRLEKICFDGDADYDWSHFYYVDGKEATIEDLNITVLDQNGKEVASELYELTIARTWYDEAQGGEVREEVNAPYGIAAANQEEGFTEYVATAVMKDDAENGVEATFHVMDKYSLNWICADVTFPKFSKKEGWRMCDRYWVDIKDLQAPVVAAGGTVLKEGRDYKITWLTRSGDLDSMETDRDKVLQGVEQLAGIPTKPGEYVFYVTGIGSYYGGTELLLDIEGEGGQEEVSEGWNKVNNRWQYIQANGAPVTGWAKIGGKWYLFDSKGWMQTGWKKSGGKWYYLDLKSGQMAVGWKKISGKWYFFKSGGIMAAKEYCKGYWLNKDGSWTYKAKASWKKSAGKWWFGDTTGWYAVNETVRIDGKDYSFDQKGYLVK